MYGWNVFMIAHSPASLPRILVKAITCSQDNRYNSKDNPFDVTSEDNRFDITGNNVYMIAHSLASLRPTLNT